MSANVTPKNEQFTRRPATTGKAAAKPGLKPRASLSSITNRSVQGSADDIVTENGIKRASNTAYKRSTSPTKASIGRSSGSTISNVEKPAADRLSVGKTPSHKPHSSITSTHRSTRPVQYSPQSASQIRPSRKPSRISPSPIPVKQKLSSPVLEPAMTKERPALGPRKPTTANMEQRLNELAIVNVMLKAAMAEDHDEETQEAYGAQADQDLAMLKAKLEEFQRGMGKEPLHTEGATTSTPIEKAEADHEPYKRKLEELTARHQEELDAAHAESTEARNRVDEISRDTANALGDLEKRLKADGSARVTRLLNDQLRTHEAKVESISAELEKQRAESFALAAKLEKQRTDRLEAESRAQQLAYEAVDLRNVIDDLNDDLTKTRERNTELDTEHSRAVDQAEKLREGLAERGSRAAKLEAQVDTLLSQFHQMIASNAEKLEDMESQAMQRWTNHGKLLKSRDQEITQLQAVIEALQTRLQQVADEGVLALESQRVRLTQEHDDAISSLRVSHEKAFQLEKDLHQDEVWGLQGARDQSKQHTKEQVQNHQEATAPRPWIEQGGDIATFEDVIATIGQLRDLVAQASGYVNKAASSATNSRLPQISDIDRLETEYRNLASRLGLSGSVGASHIGAALQLSNDENLGASILGRIAGMQQQLNAMECTNNYHQTPEQGQRRMNPHTVPH